MPDVPKKTAKPKIEDVIPAVVNAEYQRAALDFVEFIRAGKLTPSWASANSWKVNYKGQVLCYIRTSGTAPYHNLDDGSWHIHYAVYSDQEYNIPVSDEIVKLISSKVKLCTKCSNCGPANKLIINGKDFDNVCHQWLTIKNPGTEMLDCSKKLVESIKHNISENKKS